MKEFETDEDLATKGLKRVIKWVVLFWDETNGWDSVIENSEEIAKYSSGYGNFAGMSKVTCIVPINA